MLLTMLRRRRTRIAYLLGSLMLLVPSLHSPTAYSAAGDPPSGSPAGAVYELPLQGGREDAAPKLPAGAGGGGGGAGGGTGGGGSEATSLYRTENNFGSSSRVPGLAAAGAAAGSLAGVGDGDEDGGSNAGGRGTADGAIAGAGQVTDEGNTSVAAGVVLLGAIALLAGGAGVLSRRFSATS